MFDYSALTKEHGQNQWFGASATGIDLYVCGGDEGPDEAAIRQAQAVVAALDGIKAKAIAVADSFMKDDGDWDVCGIDVGLEAQRAGCDYVIGLSFDPADGSHGYGYTEFSVFFRAHEDQPPNQNHPYKLVIEFR